MVNLVYTYFTRGIEDSVPKTCRDRRIRWCHLSNTWVEEAHISYDSC